MTTDNHTGMSGRFLERFEIDYFLVAMPYTLRDQPALDEDFELCSKHGASVVVGAVYASGILATGADGNTSYAYQDASAEVLNRVRQIEAVCASFDVPLRAAALQFPLAHPLVTSVIPGANSPTQVSQNLDALKRTIPFAFWEELNDQGLVRADAPLPKAI